MSPVSETLRSSWGIPVGCGRRIKLWRVSFDDQSMSYLALRGSAHEWMRVGVLQPPLAYPQEWKRLLVSLTGFLHKLRQAGKFQLAVHPAGDAYRGCMFSDVRSWTVKVLYPPFLLGENW